MISPTARWLVQFGYDGGRFHGWARQPGLHTVEGTIRDRLVELGVSPSAEASHLQVASRTDTGVHARGNALALDSEYSGPTLLRVLNAVSPEIFFWRAAQVPDGFNPRQATERWYRYFEPVLGRRLSRWRAGAQTLRGPVDVRSFGRGAPSDHPTFRTVRTLSVSRDGSWIRIDVRAPSFVWGMVRKIVSALRAVDAGALTLTELRETALGHHPRTLPMAEPDRLVLWDVRYPLRWELMTPQLRAPQRRLLERELRSAETRSRVLVELDRRPSVGHRGTKSRRSRSTPIA